MARSESHDAPPAAPAAAARAAWRERLRVVIFEADTPGGKLFDVVLIAAILTSVIAVMLESVPEIRARHGGALYAVEWGFTLLFTLEYGLRLAAVPHPGRYARSFFGVVDLIAVLPTYVSVLVPGAQSLLVIRGLRLLRIFRVFKLAPFLGEASLLRAALIASRHKVVVFLAAILILITILGAFMYLIEGAEHGFTSIPQSVYWAIVTMTTVGYGDIAPQTLAGKLLASIAMIIGYSILAVPTGIVTAEIVEQATSPRRPITTRQCAECMSEGHDRDARFCKHCGAGLAAGGQPSGGGG
jgi:voltage-gated potassium channel